jgi:uncharacterized protein YciW
VLQGQDESLDPRARALAQVAVTLTKEPWALTIEAVQDVARQGLDAAQIEAALGVISMFNYFTRVADATGIEFDYQTPLPAFEPNLTQVSAPRPDRSAAPDRREGSRQRPQYPPLHAAWQTWRAYLLGADEPISQRERRLLACVAAEEAADWACAEALGGATAAADSDDMLVAFARKLSREPWRMQPADLDGLREAGYREPAVLHVISVVAHQNADSRLAAGLAAASRA